MKLFFLTISIWVFFHPIVGSNPVLEFQPKPTNEQNTLIWYEGPNRTSYMKLVDDLNSFLSKYHIASNRGNSKIKNCSQSNYPQPDEVCDVDVRSLEPCIKENYYSYHKSAPCIFLKLNVAPGWTPEYYDDSTSLPDDMPQTLKDHIKSFNDPKDRRNIWISCEGENPVDVELLGPYKYFPKLQGFPGYYFPSSNSTDYISPLVAVHFQRPRFGVLINIECRAWAKNINYSKQKKIGSTHFELLID